jgi:hypothetical protein
VLGACESQWLGITHAIWGMGLQRADKGRRREKKNDVPTYLPFVEILLRFLGLVLENIFVVFLGSSCMTHVEKQ